MSRRTLAAFLLLTACQRTTAVSAPSDAPAPSADASPSEKQSPDGGQPGGQARGEAPAAQSVAVASDAEPVQDELDIEVFDPEEGSLRLTRSATVFASPSGDAARLGVLSAGARIRPGARFEGPGCARGWMPLPEGGWVCAETEEDKREPREVMLPRLADGKRVPGVYGRLRKGAVIYPDSKAAKAGIGGQVPQAHYTVRRLGTVRVGGRSFWKTRHGLIERSQVRRFRASSFEGTPVGDAGLQLPVAWTLAGRKRRTVALHAEPSVRSETLQRVSPHEAFHVEGMSEDGRWVDVGEGWVQRDSVRIAVAEAPPAELPDGERWIDIDLDEQTLVAYEGHTPLYATLVSTGKVHHRTPVGVYRIERKVAERTMNSMADSDEDYSVDKVPWTVYFDTGYALHTAYWHDGFGRPRSHGCINLSPADARRLYGWTAPAVRPNWSEVYGNESQPGSVIRVRNDRNPNPDVRGYAANLVDKPTGAGAGTALAAP